MKRKCKDVDITDIEFIKNAITFCMYNKVKKSGRRVYKRDDVKEYFAKHNGSIDSIAEELQGELKVKKLNLKPVTYKNVIDAGNGKQRRLCIEHIKQQFYDYIAEMALKDLKSYIGVNQTACKEGMGQQYSAHLVYGWLQPGKIKYCIKADIRKCYQSITHENTIKWLKRHVKNDMLIWLITELLNTCEEGLPIGSFLSIRLCALYIADIYHHIENDYRFSRRGKTINPVEKVLIYLDDIFIFGSNAKMLKKVIQGVIGFASGKGLTIKEDWKLIHLGSGDKHAHIDVVGYRVYNDHITARYSNYVKLRRSIRSFKRKKTISRAKSLIARLGMFLKHTTCQRFVKKYRTKKLLRKARRLISNYDKSKIRLKTACG